MAAPVAASVHPEPLSPLEFASGRIAGRAAGISRPEVPALTPIEALENAVRPALQRGRCLISFSGGHDSSLLLGVATRVARAEGLALPIPITWRFVNASRAEESPPQESVVAALGLTDWVRLTTDDETDFVGPVAQEVLRRHGPMFPANAFFHAPLLAQAAGGTLLTGMGGDHVFTPLRRSRRPWPFASRSGAHEGYPWLRPAAAHRVWRNMARDARKMPRDPLACSRWRAESRALELGQRSLQLIAEDAGARIEHPLISNGLLSALERFGVSPLAAGGRAALLERMFAGKVPEACLSFRPKAEFGQVFWNRHARNHIAAWDGRGLDESIVDVAALRTWWQRERPMLFTAIMLQQTWLVQHAADIEPAPQPSEANPR